MLLKVLGGFLMCLPVLAIWSLLAKDYGWKAVGKAVGTTLGMGACFVIGFYLFFGG